VALINDLAFGFSVAFTPENLAFGAVGCILGTAVGVLPGLGPAVAISLLLPMTFGLDPTAAMIMFGGIYYGAMYGGSTTSILINTPGDASASVSTIEGYPMARQGRGGVALATAAIGSLLAGTFATFMLTLLMGSLAAITLLFGPPEYFALMLLALTTVTAVSANSPARAAFALCCGLLIAMIGIDLQTGVARLTFGIPELLGGVDVVLGAIGLFGIGEVLWTMASPPGTLHKPPPTSRLWLNKEEWKRSAPAWARGSLVGFFSGTLPGSGATLASFLSYAVEKRFAKNPKEFGHGAIEGLAGPEAANNAAAGGGMVPLLALGIPGSSTTAVMLVAFQLYGLQPGPSLVANNPELVWGLIASLYIANILLVVLNLPLVGIWVQLLKTPRGLLTGAILVFAALGAYSLQGSLSDVIVAVILGAFAFVLRRFGFPVAPVLLGIVIGPMIEQELRRTLAVSTSGVGVFLSRPLAMAFICIAFVSVAMSILPYIRPKKRAAIGFGQGEED
jgi:putative tricarboxylic transport membrane protein